MSRRFAVGLVVGKFSPLHLGHEWLLETAQAQCDTLLVLSYSRPEFPGCSAERRERWLHARFPQLRHWAITPERVTQWQVEHPDLPDMPDNAEPDWTQRQFVAELCMRVLQQPVEAVFTSEDYGDGFAAHLAAHFGRPVAHVMVDRERVRIPVSGTRLRADVHGLRHFLSAEVYGDFVERICLLGGESTGKSSLSVALAEALGTVYVAEFGREHWEAKGGEFELDDLLHIGRTQVMRESRAAGSANRYLICDTSPLTTRFYSETMFGKVELELQALADRPYDWVFLCDDDFPFVQDGTRQTEDFRRRQQAWYRQELERRGWPYTVLSGGLARRVAMAKEVLTKR